MYSTTMMMGVRTIDHFNSALLSGKGLIPSARIDFAAQAENWPPAVLATLPSRFIEEP
jgi:hypothetical protein